MRLIEAIVHLQERLATMKACECKREHEELLAFLLELQERRAADAVEVVRCKDCRHLLKDNSDRKAHLCVRERIAVQTSLEDYCSHAESKR